MCNKGERAKAARPSGRVSKLPRAYPLDEARAHPCETAIGGAVVGRRAQRARDVASELGEGKRVVVILPSAGSPTTPPFDAHRRSAEAELGLRMWSWTIEELRKLEISHDQSHQCIRRRSGRGDAPAREGSRWPPSF